MIKFFQKIRLKLLSENKFSKYLIYAMGEIVLVVIGILIALSINNWNNKIKDQKLETGILENIIENLEHNCEQLESRTRSIMLYRRSGKLIISAIENNSYHDSLQNYFHHAWIRTSNLKLSSIGYEALKNVGFHILENEALKKEIMLFFEENQPEFQDKLKWGDTDAADREKFIDESFLHRYGNGDVRYEPFDANELFLNRYFLALMTKTDMQRGYFSMIMKEHLNRNKKLIELIKNELKNK